MHRIYCKAIKYLCFNNFFSALHPPRTLAPKKNQLTVQICISNIKYIYIYVQFGLLIVLKTILKRSFFYFVFRFFSEKRIIFKTDPLVINFQKKNYFLFHTIVLKKMSLMNMLPIVNKGSFLTIVNEGSSLTIINKTTSFIKVILLINDRFKKQSF